MNAGWLNDREMVGAFLAWGAIIVRFKHERLELGTKNGFFERFDAKGAPAYRLTEKGRQLALDHDVKSLFEQQGLNAASPKRAPKKRKAYSKTPPAFTHCWGCVSRSVCAWPNDCPRAAEMAA